MPKLGFLSRLIGDSNEKELRRLSAIVATINELGPEVASLTDAQLREKTDEFKARLESGETLDDLLPEAFAVVRETAGRQVGERHYDVQLMGGIVLHEGKIAEMKTGEGKTLTATAPVYLNALLGRGVHVVTVNDYLARRDAAWYGPVYDALGLTVGVIQNNGVTFRFERGYKPETEGEQTGYENLRPCSRREAYECDVTYGTNNEFGFDYLRDNMVRDLSHKVQRELYYAIVDEVDNILIDEARTPLIISGQAEEASSTYIAFARAVKGLVEDVDYVIDYKAKHVALTEEGIAKIEQRLGISNIFGSDPRLVRHLEAALDAEYLKRIDRDYVVRNGEVIIVDEFTGRLMPGRRWSHGIHQAVEAKEGVKIQRESITYATITFQNYFRLYEKLAGMTGTAETEAEEFHKIYGLDVVVIPTHKPMIRIDYPDVVYINERAKFNAVVKEIEELHRIGRPVLVGTTSIEKSEYLSSLLTRRGIPHEVLNAKHHEREAKIIAKAGQKGAVTIATNMAGRGTDIKLGPGVAELGGLHVIGTERHESRRIDNQLRGRAGRQGDPGSSRFYVSFGDDLMRRFAPDWVAGMLQKLGMTEDMPLESRAVAKAIEQAQQKVEGFNFDIRKRLVEFDDVVNEHRRVIYGEREKVLRGADTRATVLDMLEQEITDAVERANLEDPSSLALLHGELREILPAEAVPSPEEMAELGDELLDELLDRMEAQYEALEERIGAETMRQVERWLLLEAIDYHWREHLTAVEEVRQSIGLQGYAGVDPLVAFKREGYDMFLQLQANIRRQVARTIFRVRIVEQPQQSTQAETPQPAAQPVLAGVASRPAANLRTNRGDGAPARSTQKIGRNDPCFCGSGKKYKKCHGALG